MYIYWIPYKFQFQGSGQTEFRQRKLKLSVHAKGSLQCIN